MPACLTLAEVRDYVAEQYGIPLSMPQLYSMVETDRGPANFRVGKRIFVHRRDVDAWLVSQIEATRRTGVLA